MSSLVMPAKAGIQQRFDATREFPLAKQSPRLEARESGIFLAIIRSPDYYDRCRTNPDHRPGEGGGRRGK
jgi:hypothetical protein